MSTITETISMRLAGIDTAAVLRRSGVVTLLTVVCSLVGGLSGFALGLVVGVLWVVLPTIYTFAIGELLYVIFVAPDGPIALLGTLAFGLLLVVEFPEPWPRSLIVRSIAVFIGASAVFVAIVRMTTLLAGAAAFALCFGLTAYVLHRYERLQLGLVNEGETEIATGADTDTGGVTSDRVRSDREQLSETDVTP